MPENISQNKTDVQYTVVAKFEAKLMLPKPKQLQMFAYENKSYGAAFCLEIIIYTVCATLHISFVKHWSDFTKRKRLPSPFRWVFDR